MAPVDRQPTPRSFRLPACLALLLPVFASPSAAGLPSAPGWPIDLGQGTESGADCSPSPVDLDGDGQLELVLGGRDGRVHVFQHDGRPMAGWPFATGSYINAMPAIGDLDDDGSADIVVISNDGFVYALKSDGTLREGWPIALNWQGIPGGGSSNQGTPAIADIDGDGRGDVITIAELESAVYVFDAAGRPLPGWPQQFAEGEWSRTGVAVADFDLDGLPEVLAGAVMTGSSQHNTVYAWHGDGRPVAGWPVRLEESRWAPISSIVTGDLDGDHGVEIVVGSAEAITVLDGKGVVRPGWPFREESFYGHFLALADAEGDGRLEIVVTSGGSDRLRVFDVDGRLRKGFPRQLYRPSPPIVADIDGDGRLEILASEGAARSVRTYGFDGEERLDLMLETVGPMLAAPTAADLDGDGTIEIAVGNYVNPSGGSNRLYVWTTGAPATPKSTPWPVYRGNLANTGGFARRSDLPPLPAVARILPSYPNPLRVGATIPYELLDASSVRLRIVDAAGRTIRSLVEATTPAGPHAVHWDGKDDNQRLVPNGAYFIQLSGPGIHATAKSLVVR